MEREVRYTVFKISDVTEALDPDEAATLIELEEKVAIYRDSVGKRPLECVVVESDWPEYDPTWAAIERRVDGRPLPSYEQLAAALGKYAAGYRPGEDGWGPEDDQALAYAYYGDGNDPLPFDD